MRDIAAAVGIEGRRQHLGSSAPDRLATTDGEIGARVPAIGAEARGCRERHLRTRERVGSHDVRPVLLDLDERAGAVADRLAAIADKGEEAGSNLAHDRCASGDAGEAGNVDPDHGQDGTVRDLCADRVGAEDPDLAPEETQARACTARADQGQGGTPADAVRVGRDRHVGPAQNIDALVVRLRAVRVGPGRLVGRGDVENRGAVDAERRTRVVEGQAVDRAEGAARAHIAELDL